MKKNLKIKRHFKGWIAFVLAFVLIAAVCVYSSDAYLRANVEDLRDAEQTTVSEQVISPTSEEGDSSENDSSGGEESGDSGEENESGEEGEGSGDNDSGDEWSESEDDGSDESGDGSGEDVSEDGEDSFESEESEEEDGTEDNIISTTESEETETEEQIPQKEETESAGKENVERSVKVTSSLGNSGVVDEGMTLVLTAHLKGFDDVDYEIQWQQSENGTNWDDIDGENGMEYTVILTEENDGYLWRASVSTSES